MNRQFHEAIYRASRNEFLADQALALHKRLSAYRRIQLRVRSRLLQSLQEHAGFTIMSWCRASGFPTWCSVLPGAADPLLLEGVQAPNSGALRLGLSHPGRAPPAIDVKRSWSDEFVGVSAARHPPVQLSDTQRSISPQGIGDEIANGTPSTARRSANRDRLPVARTSLKRILEPEEGHGR